MGLGGGVGEAAAVSAAEEAGKEDGEGPGRGWRGKVRLSRVVAVVWVLGAAAFWAAQHCGFRGAAISKAEEGLVSMCEERARMLQDQFAVSVNHVHALAILVATFHYEKHPPALDQVRARPPPSPDRSPLSRAAAPRDVLCSCPAFRCDACGL